MNDLIQWKKGAKYWDNPFNPIVGCVPVSEGCDNCYAKALCRQYNMNGDGKFTPTAKPNAKPPQSGIVFTGNMTDLFGEWNTTEQITAWLKSLSPNAANLILTKRCERLYEQMDILNQSEHILVGATAENQIRLEERLGYMFNFRHRWLSLEPLLGEIDFREAMAINNDIGDDFTEAVDWVVVGAESGAARRPCKLEWVENIVRTCKQHRVPVFVKQLDLGGRLEKDIRKFPKYLQIRQVPWSKQKKPSV